MTTVPAIDTANGLALPGRRFYFWVNLGLMLTHVQLCWTYLGPRRLHSGRSYLVLLDWAPARTWGWALLAGAVCCLAAPWLRRWPATILRGLAVLVLVGLIAGFTTAQIRGLSDSWGGIGLLLWPLAGHILIIAARHHRETRRA